MTIKYILFIGLVGVVTSIVIWKTLPSKQVHAKALNSTLVIPDSNYNFGEAHQGDTVQYSFQLQNRGSDSLRVRAVQPSCGCTVASLKDSTLAPNQSTSLKISVNLTLKPVGLISKYVRVVCNDRPTEHTISITGKVLPPLPAHATSMKINGIFEGDCKKCHVDNGEGKLGLQLYQADCAICHSTSHEGTQIVNLLADSNLKDVDLHKTISFGRPLRGMPAFTQLKGGPLTDSQITSLVQFIESNNITLHRLKRYWK